MKRWTVMLIPQDGGSSSTFDLSTLKILLHYFLLILSISSISFLLSRWAAVPRVENELTSFLTEASKLIDKEQSRLEVLGSERERIEAEITQNEALANLSREHAEAVKKEIQSAAQNPSFNALVLSFIVGVLSSGLIAVLSLFLTLYLGKEATIEQLIQLLKRRQRTDSE